MFLSFFAFSLNAWAIFRKPASTKPPAITMAAGVRGDLSGIYFNPAVAGTVVKREIFAFGDVSGLAADNFVGLMYAQPLARGDSYVSMRGSRLLRCW